MKKIYVVSMLLCLGCFASSLFGGIVIDVATNITLANSLNSTQANVVNDPDVTGGNVGDLITYTVNAAEWVSGGFDGDQLFNGNAGPGGSNPGATYAIVKQKLTGTVTLDLDGGGQQVGSIAIYNGYSNRDDGAYTLRDDSGTLGAWTISSTAGSNHENADIFWLTFKTPVTTENLFIDYSSSINLPNGLEASFAAIQPFAVVPELSQIQYMLVALLAGLTLRRRVSKA